MSRNAAGQAQQSFRTSRSLEGQSQNNSNALYNQLEPQFQNEAVNPQGFNPKEMSDLTTSNEQSAGGAMGAATGKAAQYAASNRNAGSFAPVLDESARSASRGLGARNLDVQNENAQLKEKQRQEGLAGMSGLDNQQNNDVLASIGLENQSTDEMTKASPGWMQNMEAIMKALSGAGGSKGADGSWSFSA